MSVRILIIGNSGSGKSTLAKRLAAERDIAHLDLDSIVWEPGLVAQQRPFGESCVALSNFIDGREAWIVEGCYGDLIERALPYCSELLFLNPGRETCLRRNASRAWEPHKYASLDAQDAMLPALQEWVSSYYTRDDAWSHSAHRKLFDGFSGSKRELFQQESFTLDRPSA